MRAIRFYRHDNGAWSLYCGRLAILRLPNTCHLWLTPWRNNGALFWLRFAFEITAR
jgi:hypothetical protein